jgi:GST-like protein
MEDKPTEGTSAPLVLYGMGSPNVRKILLMLEELQTPYDLRMVRVFKGEQFTPPFVQMNPFSKVPVLVDREAGEDGYPVFESGAILIYLAEKFGRFFPKSGPERYETLKWLFGQTSTVGPMLGQYNHFRTLDPERFAYPQERYRSIANRVLKILDGRLKDHRYLAGEAYSIADIATFHWAGYVDTYSWDWGDYPDLARWHREIAERPAAAREKAALARLYSQGADDMKEASREDLDRFFWRDR